MAPRALLLALVALQVATAVYATVLPIKALEKTVTNIVSGTVGHLPDTRQSKSNGRENIERPCGAGPNIDLACVRADLAARSNSVAVTEPEDSYSATTHQYLPNFNITLIKPNSVLTGLQNSVVEDYLVNTSKNVTILLVRHPSLVMSGPFVIYFESPGNPSLPVDTVFTDTYPNLYTTTLIPGTSNIDLAGRQTQFRQTEAAVLNFGDANLEDYAANNEMVSTVLAVLNAELQVLSQEALYSIAKYFADGFFSKQLVQVSGPEAYFQPYHL